MILDHIDMLELPESTLGDHDDALATLARLAEGLHWINRQLMIYERTASDKARKADILTEVAGGILEKTPLGTISCAFQWYAVSVCNYAQLANWLIYNDRQKSKDYVTRIFPKISNYRNKVAAHFAFSDPRKEDNEATLSASVITNIVYHDRHFYAATITPAAQNGIEVERSKIKPWSVTLAHQQIEKRFWPNGIKASHNAIKIGSQQTLEIAFDKNNVL
jgi:hypothetical protein